MYECVGLTKKDLKYLKELNSTRNDFNPLNEDFFKIYENSNFAQQLLLRRKVKLVRNELKYIGYIWADIIDRRCCRINAINVLHELNNVDYKPYKALLGTLRKDCNIVYNCEGNDYNFLILKELGFQKKDGTLLLNLNISKNIPLISNEALEFEVFKKGRDEEKRCEIQNKIFEEDSRIPLTLADIYFDELQDYYFEKGAVFLKKNDKYIGYGQIILENNIPLIVNFGILKKYRGRGYSKCLLSYLLKIVFLHGFINVKIKVKSSNEIAINLYKSIGFAIEKEVYNWELKR